MIVTCPGCAAKYRVNNDAVSPEGSRMRCPKCETLFLAKPPLANTGGLTDDALQQLVPAPMANVPRPSPQPSPPLSPQPSSPASGAPRPGVPGVPSHPQAAGPVTALFGAFDSSMLPPEMQRPAAAPAPQAPLRTPPPTSPTAPGAGPDPTYNARVRVANPASLVAPPPTAPAPAGLRLPDIAPLLRRAEDNLALVAASWLGLVVALAAAAGGVAFFAWSVEAADLDGSMMPRFERTFGVEPPYSRTGRDVVSIEDLRRDAAEASTRGDISSAIVLWSRARALQPNDLRAVAEIARLRAELEDND